MATAEETVVVEDSDIYHEFACTLCAEKDRNVEALKRCEECAENLCGECLENHNMFKAMRQHTLMDKADIVGKGQHNSGKLKAVLPEVPNVKCDSHPGNRVELYCGDHDVVGCSTCTSLDHKLCEDMHYIPSVAAGYKSSGEPHAVAGSISRLTRKMKLLKETGEGTLQQITEERNVAKELINERAELIKKRVDELKDMAIEEVNNHFTETEQIVKEGLRKSDSAISILEAEEEKLDCAVMSIESDLFIYTKQGKKVQEKNEKLLQELETSVVCEPLQVIVDDTALACVTRLETFAVIKPIGAQSSDTTTDDSVQDGPDVKHAGATHPGQTNNATSANEIPKTTCYKPDLSFSLEQNANVRASEDEHVCNIVSCLCMDNGKLVVIVDYSNKCVKVFDKSFKLLTRNMFLGIPFAGCSVGERELAFFLDQKRIVQFATISVTNKLHLTRSFSVGEVVHGMSYSNQRLYLSCGGRTSNGEGPGHLRIYYIDGTLLQKIQPIGPPQHILSIPLRLSANSNGNCVVANRKKGVIAFDSTGRAIWHCHPNTVLWATGICEIDDKVTVCCCSTGNVVEISPASLTSRILLHGSEVHQEPLCMSYNKQSGKLFVASAECDYILVYKRQ